MNANALEARVALLTQLVVAMASAGGRETYEAAARVLRTHANMGAGPMQRDAMGMLNMLREPIED